MGKQLSEEEQDELIEELEKLRDTLTKLKKALK